MAPRSIFFAAGPHVNWRAFHATPDYVGWIVATWEWAMVHWRGIAEFFWIWWMISVLGAILWGYFKPRIEEPNDK